MTRFFLEDVWKLAVLLGVLQFCLVCLWSWTRARQVAIANWVVLGLIPILLALSIFIATPSEQIIETCRRVAIAIDDGDMQTIGAHVATDFHAGDFDRDSLLEKLENALTRVRVDNPRLRSFEISLASPMVAEVVFRASCRVRTPNFSRNGLPSKWRILFRRDGKVWQITEIESLPVPPMNLRVLGDWLR